MSLSFQEVIMRLESYWSGVGALIWQPYSEKVGAGTMNPATILRVLGPEPWNVGYVEPSFRPDDGRYAENPNRMQMHTQYQVILKPDPGNPQELYLRSLEALGIRREEHDIRFVEDNWESPALGAWGLGWEVWLDGLEITQFTYFQQAGSLQLNPVAVEITYGLERIVMFLQGVNSVWDIDWDGLHTYGDIYKDQEIDYCRYNFDYADVDRLREMYGLFEEEAKSAIGHGLPVPAHDYILRCSHTFNVLDARGAVGVTERATFFRRMRALAREVAKLYVKQREEKGFPWLEKGSTVRHAQPLVTENPGEKPTGPAPLLLEIGTEELPARDVDSAVAQLGRLLPKMLDDLRIAHGEMKLGGTPRRIVAYVEDVAPVQKDVEELVKGPPAKAAFAPDGTPTKAAEGFARSMGVSVDDLTVKETDKGPRVFAVKRIAGRESIEAIAEALPGLIASIKFEKSMRWNDSGVAFSRPIRWFAALLGEAVIPFSYAGVESGRKSLGTRPAGSPVLTIPSALEYWKIMAEQKIVVDRGARREKIKKQIEELAKEVGGAVPDEPDLLDEVTNLVERPTAVLGSFEEEYLDIPQEVLMTVMKKHQRYFPVVNGDGKLLPHFIAIRNGDDRYVDVVRHGYESVLRARYADARFFFQADTSKKLEEFLPRLGTLTFQEDLGSMLDKVKRLEELAPWVAEELGYVDVLDKVRRAAHLCKADLATQMVVEFTSLQGVMGREYALRSGEDPEVAEAIFEHYLPRFAGDKLPETKTGIAVGIADRLDSLTGLFAVGLAPTGSADPYHMRRDALGLVQVLIGREISFEVGKGVEEAAKHLPVQASQDALQETVAFVRGRLKVWLRDKGFRYDVVDAVLEERGDNPYLAYRTVEGLQKVVESGDWSDVFTAYSRSKRIVRDLKEEYPLVPERLKEPAEQALLEAYLSQLPKIERSKTPETLLEVLRALKDPINRFFEEVLVMADDPEVRAARLGLVQRIAALPDGIADLSKLQGF